MRPWTVDSTLYRIITLLLNVEKELSPCIEGESRDKMWSTKRRVSLDVLLACFGMSTWLGVNGLFLQLPLLVERLPERWALPSWMTLAIELANIGLLIYGALRRLFPRVSDALYIYVLLVIGTLALIFNAIFYTETVALWGSERSVVFLSLVFVISLFSCTSSVLFYPYLRHFRDIYLVTFLLGEGLSGFLPTILALLQGVGGEPECTISADNSTLTAVYPQPRFNTTIFLLLLGALSFLSLISFAFIQSNSIFGSERKSPSKSLKENIRTQQSLLQVDWIWVMILTVILNALTGGVLNSVQSYSCMPYGARTYHLAAALRTLSNPLVCLAAVWLPLMSPRMLGAALSTSMVPLCYILATSLLSPTPPLQNQFIGKALVVVAWLAASAVLWYGRMWSRVWAQRGGARGMRACGAATQLGSLLGVALVFLLINYTQLFKQAPECSNTLL